MENFYFTPCLILSFCLAVFINQSNAEYDNCYDDENNVLLACNPPSYDVMWNNVAKIKVEPTTATCGIPASKFRRLATRMTTISETCDAAIPQFQHNPEFMIDDNTTSTWWQSTNLSPGSEEMNINITVSFNKTFRMDSDLVITFNSGRPDKMIVMKSADFGVTWTPLQYYAKNCDDFQSVVVPGAAITVDTPTAITCTSEYVEQTPRAVANRTVVLVNQERFDLFLGPIGINFSAFYEAMEQKLMNFLTFTDIRIQLIKPLTDDRGLYDAYYYAISDIQLVSRCWCNLHASFCNYGADGFYCDCQHNTTGKNCEMCQPLFNERQWQKGSYIPYPKGQANECIKCECNNHALSCTFNATYGRGICDTCLHNTEGYHCELCAPTYFPNVSLALNDINRCIECKCEPLGVLDNNLTCAQTEKTSVSIGQCNCKPLVTSLRCNTCVTGYYGLLTGPTPGSCTACNCNQMGTVGGSINCTQDGGQCSCKQSITGRTCDICKDMYYSFPANNPQGECSACGCDKGGSLLSVCDKVSGQCTCRTNITGDKCTEALPGTYVPAVDILLYQPVPGACNVTSDLYTDQAPFDGGKFAVCDVSSRNVTLEFDTIKGGQLQKDLQWPYILVVRYSTNNSWVSGTVKLQAIGSTSADLSPLATKLGQQNVTFQCPYNGLTGQVEMMFKPGISSAVLSQTHNLTLDARCTYSLTLQLFSSNSNQSVGNITDSAIEIDSLVLLPTLSSTDGSTSFNFYDASDNKIVLKDKYLSCLQQLSDLKMRQITLLTSPCREILFSVGAELFNGSKACDCLSISSVSSLTCQELGGQCQCKPGVYGRACDICKPGYFNFSENGCSPCNCHPKGAETGYCNITSGICQCKPNILSLKDNANITLISEMNIKIDGTCGRCLPNYYGIDSGKGCVPCYCSVNGSTDQQCDETGQCPCKDTVTGLKCNICKDGYYDFGSNGCSPCNCSTSGSTQLTCHQLTGTCTCKSNVEGTKCSLCKTGFFNLASYNLDGCQPCFCYNHSMNCTSAVGYQSKLLQVANPATPGDYEIFLGDRHWSYGQSLTVKFSVIKEIDLTGEILVSLTGAGKSLHFVAPNGTGFNSNRFLTISTRLLEQNWMMEKNETTVKPHAQEMLDILANLTAISTITKAKDQQITTVYLGLEWAENNKSVESIGVNFVENCICAETSNTAGLSCEKCSRGYMREDLVHFSSFSNCVACNCSRRGITDPPECDELTGICVNCRNGTTGNHCEKCSPHVVEPECVTCESTYWGLQANGCRECNCSEPGAKSNYCNPVSGQCTCAANVIGRTCDQCQENFYNISINGCIECDSCYATLSVAILPLRQLELEISSNITFLKVSDITSINGAFMTHYLEATKQTKQLNDFLTSIQQSEADIKNSIQEFNITISSFETEIETIQNNKTIDIERLLSSSESVIKMALSYRSILEDNIVFIYNKLASLQGSQSSLANLANSLKTVEQHLVSIANSSFSDQQILINLSTLNNTLFLTNQLVNDAQQKADVASQIHKNNTSALLALDTRISTLSNEADKVLSNAKSLGANDILAAATKLRTQLSQFVSFKLDNSNLVDKLVKMRGEVTSLQTLLTAEVSFFNTTNVNALATVPRADELSNQSRIIGFSSSEWMARSNTAAQRAASFQSQASTMLQDANKTLWTLNNFKVRVGDALQQVDALNLKVSPTLTLSEQLIQQSQNLTQTLALLQQTASAAKEYSQQALIMISLRQKEFQTVTAESSQLQTRLNDIADLSIERFRALNNTKFYVVQPGALQCSALNSSVLDYQDQLSSTQKVVATSLVQIANLTQRANDIIGQLHSLNKIDSASISVLFSNIQSAQNVLNVDNLKLTISNLLIQKNVQRKKIDNLKLMRDNLKSKIQSLKAFQNQIIST